ncbi:MAG TPA: DUF2934 domain-containing protein [Alphaproteobacteria bacterium]
MTDGRDDEIRKRAHEIWEQEGRPDGRDKDHWDRAERELMASVPVMAAEVPVKLSRTKAAAAPKAAVTRNAGSRVPKPTA